MDEQKHVIVSFSFHNRWHWFPFPTTMSIFARALGAKKGNECLRCLRRSFGLPSSMSPYMRLLRPSLLGWRRQKIVFYCTLFCRWGLAWCEGDLSSQRGRPGEVLCAESGTQWLSGSFQIYELVQHDVCNKFGITISRKVGLEEFSREALVLWIAQEGKDFDKDRSFAQWICWWDALTKHHAGLD